MLVGICTKDGDFWSTASQTLVGTSQYNIKDLHVLVSKQFIDNSFQIQLPVDIPKYIKTADLGVVEGTCTCNMQIVSQYSQCFD